MSQEFNLHFQNLLGLFSKLSENTDKHSENQA